MPETDTADACHSWRDDTQVIKIIASITDTHVKMLRDFVGDKLCQLNPWKIEFWQRVDTGGARPVVRINMILSAWRIENRGKRTTCT